MFKRIIQGISQLFTARQLATTSHDGTHPPETWPRQRSSGGGVATGCGSQTQRPPSSFPSPRLRVNADGSPHRRDEAPRHHSATQLLRDGHLQIGITGFNDSAFSVSIMGRHDAPHLAAAISDLPCRVKMVAERNIADGLLAALRTLDTSEAGRRGVVLVTSGDSSIKEEWTRELAETAAQRRIGIHVICLGPKADDPTCGPRINTKDTLGYGGFRLVETADQLLAAIRDSFDGLTPAFGMKGTNKAMILLDCSEAMVEAYRNTTRIELVITCLREFLKDPLIRNCSHEKDNRTGFRHQSLSRRKPVSWQSPTALAAAGGYDWSPRST